MTHPSARRRLVSVAGAVAAALAASAWTPGASATDAATFEAAHEAGEAARKAAAAVGFEWRDTKKMLKQARKLAEEEKYEEAVALANQARRQGEHGVAQAKEQEAAWQRRVLR